MLCLTAIFAVLIYDLFKNNQSDYSEIELILLLSCLMSIIGIWFNLKFRFKIHDFEFRTSEYTKQRGDIEEKIVELQNAINISNLAWKDNNHLALSGQQNVWDNDSQNMYNGLRKQFGIEKKI